MNLIQNSFSVEYLLKDLGMTFANNVLISLVKVAKKLKFSTMTHNYVFVVRNIYGTQKYVFSTYNTVSTHFLSYRESDLMSFLFKTLQLKRISK